MISFKPFFGLLAEKRISRVELTRLTGISYPVFKKMKEGKTLDIETIDVICRKFNVGIEDVMRYEDDPVENYQKDTVLPGQLEL